MKLSICKRNMQIYELCLILLLKIFAATAVANEEFDTFDDGDENNWDIFRTPQGYPVLAQASELNINEFLVGVIENFKEGMTTGIPELKIPILDPFEARKPINVDIEEPKASFHGNFTDVQVTGLSKFDLEYLDVDLVNLTLKFGLTIPYIRGAGNYSMKGMVIKIVPLRGNGEFWVESHNLTLSTAASIVKNESNYLQVSDDIEVEMDFDYVKMDLENFLGGGKWTEILKNILNNVSKSIFHKFLPLLKKELNKALLKVINKKLSKLPINIGGSTPNEYVDEILVNVQRFIAENNYDPMELPQFNSNFSKEMWLMTVYGEAKLYDGILSGISTLHRTDECQMEANKTTISISAHLGLSQLKLKYKGHAKFMTFGPSIECGGRIDDVSFFFSIEQSNKRGSKPILKAFEIVHMSTIWIELSGLGPLTWVMKYLLTGISKLVDSFIVEKVTQSLREYVEEEFQKVSFPVY